ncbi:hypothetical protein Hanom_Chr04g00373671 [Helianthus anomalus]
MDQHHGVPPHLLKSSVFNSIGERYGVVVQSSQLRVIDGNLSMKVLGILTGNGNKISWVCNLRWQDKILTSNGNKISGVSEDSGAWIPDCLEPLERSEPTSSEFLAHQGTPVEPEKMTEGISG